MKRLLLILAAIVATGGIAAAPAVAGLAGNPSFSHQIPVPVPSKAQQPSFADDHSRDGAVTAATSIASTTPATAHPEPGDDRGDATAHPEPSDDRGDATPHAEPSDDRGDATPHAEPSDDHGGRHHDGRS
jgi:hypothetical protein